jgi:hypothetical protein
MIRDSVVIYRNLYEALQDVSERSYKRIMNAILRYSLDGEESELNGVEKAVFQMAKTQVDANNRKYENGKLGAESGSLGGRPKKEKTPQENPTEQETPTKPQQNPKETPTKPQDNPTETPQKPLNVKCKMLNDKCLNLKVSKKVSINKNISNTSACACESYDELLSSFGVEGEYREAVFRFIAYLRNSFSVHVSNNRLEELIIKLDRVYELDSEKVTAIDEAIVKGYKFIGVEVAS